MSNDDIGFELPQLPDEVDHVDAGVGLRSGPLLDVEIDSIAIVEVEPTRNLDSHGLGFRLASQPSPRIVLKTKNKMKLMSLN